MELEELADKKDGEVDVLGKNPSLRSHQRFPRDEAVLARFGKQQQFRASSPIQSLPALLHSLEQLKSLKSASSLTQDVVYSEDSAFYP